MRRVGLLLACLASAAVVACPPPRDVTPLIPVNRRAALWSNYLGHAEEVDAGAGARARVHVMRDGEQLAGPGAVGRPGDLLLENDEVAFVIDQLGSSAGFAESGGNIVDAADARVRKDDLGQIFTYFGAFPRQGVYDALSSGVAGDGAAWVEARGRELYEPKVTVVTRYTLRPTDRALLLETTLENTGDKATSLPSLGDAIQWAGAEKIAPGKAPGFRGPSSGPYVGGVGRFTSYAMTSTEGAVQATSGGSWTDTAIRASVKLGPGEKTKYARVFVVGERADTTSLVGELALAAEQDVGDIEVHVAGGPLGSGEAVRLQREGTQEAMSLVAPFAAHVPVGRYWASLAQGTPSRFGPVEVKKGEPPARIDVPVEARASLDLGCHAAGGEALPCKLTIEGRAGAPSPDFGAATAAGPARNQVTTAGSPVHVLVASGAYRVTASRGPEYTLDAVDVDLRPGEARAIQLAPARVVDTRGYLACDFHQHSVLGADAGVATRDRVIANAAEGVEVAVASEHNVVADFEPIVRDLGLARVLVSIAGDEMTSDASRHPWGHANAWPLPVDPAGARGGAPLVRDRTARELFEALRASRAAAAGASDFVLQINHPRSGSTGYFDLLGFDPARGEASDPASGYDAAFDALEVWNGRNVEARSRVLEDWRAILRTGHPVTATADTDTHGIVGQEAGYPRTYVRVSDDGPLDAWDAARTADVVRGVKRLRDVVLTNGPMLRVSANGVGIGGVARGHVVHVKVHVEAAPWVDVGTLRVVRARDDLKDPPRSVKLTGRAGAAWAAEATFVLRFDADDAFFVVASGDRPLSPVLAGDASDIQPWAMTGAIWVDADGDGTSLGR